MHPASPLSLESTVGGYRLLRPLGEGEVATVHEAEHALLPRRAAIKLLRADAVGSPQAAQRILREACVLEALGHPGVARVFDAGVLADGRPWVALELVGGESLAAVLTRTGALAPDRLLELAIALADVLAAAHRAGIVHRALGTQRVMIGGTFPVRVLGWGLARQPGSNLELTTDRRGDVYALGAMLYHAATGKPPFVSLSPVDRVMSQFHAPAAAVATLRPELPAALASLIDAMVGPEPSARPTAPEAAAALAAVARPYDDYEVVADGTDPGGEVREPVEPRTEADRDWEQLMALAVGRHRWSGTGNAAASRNDGRAPSARGK